MVYLIHFERPIGSGRMGRAQHYIGYTWGPSTLPERLEHHYLGTGSRLMAAVSAAGIEWELVRTWVGGRTLERKLKNRKKAAHLCPYCTHQRRTRT